MRASRGDYATLPWSPGRQNGGMAEKGKSRGTGAKSKQEKSRTPVQTQSRQSKKTPKTPGRTPIQPMLSLDEEAPPKEPLDVGPILDDLLDRVLTECALATAARQRVPFTVSRARDAILFVAEWRFLVRDDGDPDRAGDPDPERDGVWSEDEEPQTSHWDSCTPGSVDVADAPLSSKEVPYEDLPVATEAKEAPLVRPGEAPDAVSLLDVPLSRGEVPAATPPCQSSSATAAAPSAEALGAVTAVPVTEPAQPEPPIAPRPPKRGRRLFRPRQPRRPAPLDASRPRAALSAMPLQPSAQTPRESHEGTVAVGDRVPPPPPSSLISLASVQPRRPSRSTGLPRLSARREAIRWVLPEVKVIEVTTEPERVRPVASRSRLIASGTRQVLPVAGLASRGEPQLCDPWLASARLAPGVTVRWGNSERRGPALARHGRHGDGEQEEDEAVRNAEKELKPILPSPECLISDDGDGEQQLENSLGMQQLPGVVPAPGGLSACWGFSSPRVSPEPEMALGTEPCGTPGAWGSLPALLKKNRSK